MVADPQGLTPSPQRKGLMHRALHAAAHDGAAAGNVDGVADEGGAETVAGVGMGAYRSGPAGPVDAQGDEHHDGKRGEAQNRVGKKCVVLEVENRSRGSHRIPANTATIVNPLSAGAAPT